MGESAYLTYYQINRDEILNTAKNYCENNKKRLREQARDKYRNLSEGKNKKEYGKNRYLNMSEEKKKRQTEYQKIIVRQYNNIIMNNVISPNIIMNKKNFNCNFNFNSFLIKI